MQPRPQETTNYVRELFAGRVDKGGKPYYLHCINVMMRLGSDASDELRNAALLHDVLEDTPVTAEDLLARGYSKATVEAVQLVTRPSNAGRESYLEWIRRIAESGNEMAIRVKIADNEDNLSPERIAALPEQERSIGKRYQRSLAILRPALAEIARRKQQSSAMVIHLSFFATLLAVTTFFALLSFPVAIRVFLTGMLVYAVSHALHAVYRVAYGR